MKDTEVKLTDAVSPAYQKWFDQFPEIEILPIKEWKLVHIISYWTKLYKNHYSVDFTFKFNHTAPSKSFEVLQIKKISNMLSSDPEILKGYIDFFFEKIIITKKKRITSLALVADSNVINEYKKLLMNPNQSIDRTTFLPANYMNIIKSFNAPISNYGDLAFIKDSEDYGEMMKVLVGAGFDVKVLDKVK